MFTDTNALRVNNSFCFSLHGRESKIEAGAKLPEYFWNHTFSLLRDTPFLNRDGFTKGHFHFFASKGRDLCFKILPLIARPRRELCSPGTQLLFIFV